MAMSLCPCVLSAVIAGVVASAGGSPTRTSAELATCQDHIECYRNTPHIYYNCGCLEEALSDSAHPLKGGDRMCMSLVVTDKIMGMLGYVDRLKEFLVSKVSLFTEGERHVGIPAQGSQPSCATCAV
jgi:hypothetical protein